MLNTKILNSFIELEWPVFLLLLLLLQEVNVDQQLHLETCMIITLFLLTVLIISFWDCDHHYIVFTFCYQIEKPYWLSWALLMIPIALGRSCFCIGNHVKFCLFFVLREITSHSRRALVPEKGKWIVLCRSPCAWCHPAYNQTVNGRDCFSQQPHIQPIGTCVSTIGLRFVIEVASSRSGVWWADIICICILDYTSPRPVGKASVHVELHLEECTTSEVRVCGRKGASYSLVWCQRISLDPLGYRATQQIGRNLTLIYILLWGWDQVTCHRGRIFFPHERDLAGLNPESLHSRGFQRGGLMWADFARSTRLRGHNYNSRLLYLARIMLYETPCMTCFMDHVSFCFSVFPGTCSTSQIRLGLKLCSTSSSTVLIQSCAAKNSGLWQAVDVRWLC